MLFKLWNPRLTILPLEVNGCNILYINYYWSKRMNNNENDNKYKKKETERKKERERVCLRHPQLNFVLLCNSVLLSYFFMFP